MALLNLRVLPAGGSRQSMPACANQRANFATRAAESKREGGGIETEIDTTKGFLRNLFVDKAPAALSDSAPGTTAQAAPPPMPTTATSIDHSLDPFKAMVQDKKFFCTQCGKCCTGDGEIWITAAEATNIAKFLNMGLAQFYAKYTKQYNKYKGFHLIKNKLGSEACSFLQPDNKCGIHTVRPGQCSTYPWWPELMDRKGWDWEKETICEGFDHPDATELDVEDAARQLRQATLQDQMRMLASSKGSKKDKAAGGAGAQ